MLNGRQSQHRFPLGRQQAGGCQRRKRRWSKHRLGVMGSRTPAAACHVCIGPNCWETSHRLASFDKLPSAISQQKWGIGTHGMQW